MCPDSQIQSRGTRLSHSRCLSSFNIPPHLGSLSSAGIARRPRSYGPLRHPANPACPSRRSSWRVHTIDRVSRVATSSIFHACWRHYPGGRGPVHMSLLFPSHRRPSPNPRRVGFRVACFEACSAFTSRSGLHGRYLHEPPRPLPAESDNCWVGFAPTRKTRLSTAH